MYELSDGTGYIKKIFTRYSIKDGYYHGEFNKWFPENEKSKYARYQISTQYSNGVKDGYETEWFYHDQVYSSQFYINGKRFGFNWRYLSGGADKLPSGKKEFDCYINDIKGQYSSNQVYTDLGRGEMWHECLDPNMNDGKLFRYYE